MNDLPEVIQVIKSSATPAEAKERLIVKYELSPIQAQAILDMRLQRLTGLEREKIVEEYEAVLKDIARFKEILSNERLVLDIIKEEIAEIQNEFADVRRAEIVHDTTEINIEDMIVEEDMVVTVSNAGYIKRSSVNLYPSRRRGGKGRRGTRPRQEDFVELLFVASTHDNLLFFTNLGLIHLLKVYQLPEASPLARGKAIVNLLQLQESERVATILPVREFETDMYVVMATRKGVVKKTDLMAYGKPRAGGIIALKIDEDDELICARITDGRQQLFFTTRAGKSLRAREDEIRPMGRVARGVKGMAVNGSSLVGMEVISEEATILTVSENGFGKRTETKEYPLRRRGGKGVISMRTSERNGPVIGFRQVGENDEIMLITDRGRIIRMMVNEISVIGRITQGVRLIDIEPDERVVDLASLAETEEEEE